MDPIDIKLHNALSSRIGSKTVAFVELADEWEATDDPLTIISAMPKSVSREIILDHLQVLSDQVGLGLKSCAFLISQWWKCVFDLVQKGFPISDILASIVWLKQILATSVDFFTISTAFTEEKEQIECESIVNERSHVLCGVEKEEHGEEDDDVDWFFEDSSAETPSFPSTHRRCDGKDEDQHQLKHNYSSPTSSQRISKCLHQEEIACDVSLQIFDMLSMHKNHMNLDAEHIMPLGIAGISTRNSRPIFGFVIPLNQSHWASWCDFCIIGDNFAMNRVGLVLLEKIFDDLDVSKGSDNVCDDIRSSTDFVASMNIRMIATHESISKRHRALIMKLWNTFVVSELPIGELKRLELASGVPILPCLSCTSREEVQLVHKVQGIEMGWKKPSDAIFYESKKREKRISECDTYLSLEFVEQCSLLSTVLLCHPVYSCVSLMENSFRRILKRQSSAMNHGITLGGGFLEIACMVRVSHAALKDFRDELSRAIVSNFCDGFSQIVRTCLWRIGIETIETQEEYISHAKAHISSLLKADDQHTESDELLSTIMYMFLHQHAPIKMMPLSAARAFLETDEVGAGRFDDQTFVHFEDAFSRKSLMLVALDCVSMLLKSVDI